MNLNLLKSLLGFTAVLCFTTGNAQTIDITANAGTSATPALGTSNYVVNESIYTETEVGAANFTTAGSAITHVGLSPNTVGANTTFNNVSIYMKDVPSTTTTFTAGTYSTAGYTLVFSGSATISATGFTDILLTTPYIRTTGNNLQVMITRADNVTHSSYIWNCANGNNTSSAINTTRRYNGATALSGTTNLAVSTFRQAIRLKHLYDNDAGVNLIYTLTKLPIPNAAQQSISALITNYGANTLTNVPVTLTITGANSYSQSVSVASLASGATTTVIFPATNFTSTGTNNVTVSVASDDYASNNAKTLSQLASANTWSYSDAAAATGGVGFTGATGDFVAKFNTSIATFLTQVSVNFSAGGQPFKIGIWDATGPGGAPGTLLWESASNTSTAGVYIMPISPAVALAAGNFFIGVRQIATANVSFSYQTESPIRPSTFYYASPTGSSAWNDFAPANPFRFMIEPKLMLPADAGISQLAINGASSLGCSGVAQSVSATVSNTGANAIAPGAATVNLKIGGANTYTATAANSTTIAAGGSEVVTFSNITFNNPGTNFDTAYVVLSGDQEPANDTFRRTHQTQPTTVSIPVTESYESTPYLLGNVQQLAGTGNWTLQAGSATNVDLAAPLPPHSGGNFILFNAYNYTTMTASRLYGNCITIPALGSTCTNPYLGFWMGHDNSYPTGADSLYVAISNDGGGTWIRVAGYGRYNSQYNVPGWAKETIDLSGYAGQTILIGFDAISRFGNIVAVDDIMIGSQAVQQVSLAGASSSNVNLQLTCDDGGWSYYADPLVPNENVLAINWDPGNTNANTAAKAAATPTITLDANAYSAENTATQKATYTMKRYWNVNIGSNTLTAPVNIRFFYDSLEVTAVNNAVSGFLGANGGTAASPTWFKTISGAFAPSPAQVTVDGVTNAIPLINVNTTNARINGIPYAQFNGITSFSGGTFAGGVGANTPLPLSGMEISAKAMGSRNMVSWTLNNAVETSYFWLEKSTDGKHFIQLQKVAAHNSKAQPDYTAYDEAPGKGTSYYRVKLVALSGNNYYSNVVSLKTEGNAALSVFPNPTKDIVHVNIFSNEAQVAIMTLTDNVGKVIYRAESELSKGDQTITIPVSGYAAGSYLLKVSMGNEIYSHKVTVY